METKALRVFLSSTAMDLRAHREKAAQVVESLGNLPLRMETFRAEARMPVTACLKKARECDALIVMVAHRYGWVPDQESGGDGKRSITWLEVNAALEAGKPVFAFLVRPNARWSETREQDELLHVDEEGALEVYRRTTWLVEFRQFLSSRVICDHFTTPDDLGWKIAVALSEWVARCGEIFAVSRKPYRLQAAMPKSVRAGLPTELLVTLSQPFSTGLTQLIGDSLRPTGHPGFDMRETEIEISFPIDHLCGQTDSAEVLVEVTAPSLADSRTERVEVSVDSSCLLVPFTLAPSNSEHVHIAVRQLRNDRNYILGALAFFAEMEKADDLTELKQYDRLSKILLVQTPDGIQSTVKAPITTTVGEIGRVVLKSRESHGDFRGNLVVHLQAKDGSMHRLDGDKTVVEIPSDSVLSVGTELTAGCFPSGTLVLDVQGKPVPIEVIEPGFNLLTWDLTKGKPGQASVIAVHRETATQVVVLNKRMRISPSQPVRTQDRWKPAGELTPADLLVGPSGKDIRLTSISILSFSLEVFHISTSELQPFFAHDILVQAYPEQNELDRLLDVAGDQTEMVLYNRAMKKM